METATNFIFLGSKVTADGECSHEVKRLLLLGTKVKSNLDSIFKSRDITLPTKVCLVKAMFFPVVMYGCESWTIKKASVQFSRSVMSDSLQPHELQHTRPPGHHQLPEFTQTQVHGIGDSIQPSYPLSSPSPVLNLSQHQGLFQ